MEGTFVVEDRLLTLKELAAYLKINERTALKLVAEGALPAVRLGNQWRFRKFMVDAWLDDQMLGISHHHIDLPSKPAERQLLFDLASCFQPDHIIPELATSEKKEVVQELAH